MQLVDIKEAPQGGAGHPNGKWDVLAFRNPGSYSLCFRLEAKLENPRGDNDPPGAW